MCDKIMPYKHLYVGYTYFVLPAVTSVFPVCLRLYTLIKRTALKYYFAEKKIRYWRQNKDALLSLADKGYKTKVQQLGLDWIGRKSRHPKMPGTNLTG